MTGEEFLSAGVVLHTEQRRLAQRLEKLEGQGFIVGDANVDEIARRWREITSELESLIDRYRCGG